jgi:hypothetical protein
MCENVYEKFELRIEDYSAIVHEVWYLLGVENVFETLGNNRLWHDTSLLNARLQELLDDLKNQPSDRLVAYLRYSSGWSERLQAWQPLLDAAVAQAFTKNEEKTVRNLFIGLIPHKRDES